MNPSQNDSFGSFSSGQGGYIGQPGAYSAEPVVLGNDGRKKSKKWVVVLIVVLLFLVVAGVMFAVWKSRVPEGGDKDNEISVNRYINLLMLGKDSEEKIGEEIDIDSLFENEDENTKNIYTSLRMFSYDDEENISYYNALKDALAKTSSLDVSDDRWKEIVFLANNSLEMIPRYFVATFLADTDASYNYYIKHKSFDGFLYEYGYPFDKSSEVLLQDYDALINASVETKKEMYESINLAGCLKTDGIDYDCLELLNSEDIKNNQLENINYNMAVSGAASQLLDHIVINANSMRIIIDGVSND